MQRAQGFGPMSRGRKSPCPTTSDSAIDSALLDYVLHCPCDRIFDLRDYSSLKRSKAVKGGALAQLEPLVVSLLKAQPAGRLQDSQLRQRILALTRSHTHLKLNQSKFTDEAAGSWRQQDRADRRSCKMHALPLVSDTSS